MRVCVYVSMRVCVHVLVCACVHVCAHVCLRRLYLSLSSTLRRP